MSSRTRSETRENMEWLDRRLPQLPIINHTSPP
jgi:hypothetical protein